MYLFTSEDRARELLEWNNRRQQPPFKDINDMTATTGAILVACDECNQKVTQVVSFRLPGYDDDLTLELCADCLKKALALCEVTDVPK